MDASAGERSRQRVLEATEEIAGGIVLAAQSAGVQLSDRAVQSLFQPFSSLDAQIAVEVVEQCRSAILRLVKEDTRAQGSEAVDDVLLPTSWAESYRILGDLDDPPGAYVVLETVLNEPGEGGYVVAGYGSLFAYDSRSPTWEPDEQFIDVDDATAAAQRWFVNAPADAQVEVVQVIRGVGYVRRIVSIDGVEEI